MSFHDAIIPVNISFQHSTTGGLGKLIQNKISAYAETATRTISGQGLSTFDLDGWQIRS